MVYVIMNMDHRPVSYFSTPEEACKWIHHHYMESQIKNKTLGIAKLTSALQAIGWFEQEGV